MSYVLTIHSFLYWSEVSSWSVRGRCRLSTESTIYIAFSPLLPTPHLSPLRYTPPLSCRQKKGECCHSAPDLAPPVKE